MLYAALVHCGISQKRARDFNIMIFNLTNDTDKTEEDTLDEGNENEETDWQEEDNEVILKVIKTAKFEEYVNDYFRQCIEYYQRLLIFCNELQDFFTPMLLPTMVFAMFYIILIAFVFVTVNLHLLILKICRLFSWF